MFDRNKWNFLLWIHYLKYISIFDFLWLLDYSFVHYVVIFVSFEMMFQTCSYLSEKIFQLKVQIHSFRTFVHKFACFLTWKCIEYVGSRRVNVFFFLAIIAYDKTDFYAFVGNLKLQNCAKSTRYEKAYQICKMWRFA